MNSELVPCDPRHPEQIVVEGELLDDACEVDGCDKPGQWVIDPYQAEIYDEEVFMCLCDDHLQDRYDDI